MRPLRFALTALLLSALAACTDPGPPPGGSVDVLQLIDVEDGDGAVAAPGSTVTVHYTGWLYDEHAPDSRGSQFDSSHRRGEPFAFLLGAGRVIPGWDEGVAGMRVGGTRVLLIPAADAYGRRGAGGDIPPHSSLVFEVELLAVDTP